MKSLYMFLLTWMGLSFCYAQPCHTFTCSLKDKSGNSWFCSETGVYVHDGKSLKQYTVKDGLADNAVYCILEDRSGRIWFGTQSGVCYYDGKQFRHFPIPGLDEGSNYCLSDTPRDPCTSKSIVCILQDKKGNLWFGSTGKGLFCYTNRYFIHFQYNNGNWNQTPGNSLINLSFADQVSTMSRTHQPAIRNVFEDTQGITRFITDATSGSGNPEYFRVNPLPVVIYRFDGLHVKPVTQ